MLTTPRSASLHLGLALSLLSIGGACASTAPGPAPVALPSLTFSLLSTPVGTPGVSVYQAVLTGFVFTPSDLGSLTPAQISNYSIAAFQEKQFEAQVGAAVLSVQGTTAATPGGNPGDLDWLLSGDATVASPVVQAVPEDPLPPSDPYVDTFVVTVLNPTGANPVSFPNVPFYYKTVAGLGTNQFIPFIGAVPEPSTFALLGLCVTGVLGMAVRRRRA